jgi:transposase
MTTNGDPRREEARRLRVDPGMSRAQLMAHFGVGSGTLSEWLRGIEPPAWTQRPNAKDDLRQRAIEMRDEGSSVPKIAAALGVSKSTAYLWTKHLPLPFTPEEAAAWRSERSKESATARWAPINEARDTARDAINRAERRWVGELSDREVMMLGALCYGCEGTKAKPWEPNRCRVTFINSDPGLILLFLRFLELAGEERGRLLYRIHIHESADVRAAERWWADLVGVPVEQFAKPTLKTHNPSTVRLNVGDSYRGCLIVRAPRSRELYWRIEGLVGGITGAGASPRGGKM